MVQALLKDVNDHLEALNFKLSERANDSRSVFQRTRWERKRLSDAFISGDHKKYLAAAVAKDVVDYIHSLHASTPLTEFFGDSVLVNPSAADFDPKLPAVWQTLDSDTGAWIQAVLDVCKDKIQPKIESLDNLLAEKKKFVGSLGHVSGACMPANWPSIAHLQYTTEPGGEGWMIACHQNYKRSNADAIPVPGVPQLFHALDATFVLHLCSIEKVLAQHISFTDFEGWCESLGGQSFIKEEVITIVVDKGTTVFVPAGQYWACAHVEVEKYHQPPDESGSAVDSDAEEVKRPGVDLTPNSVGHAIVFPMWCAAWLDALPNNVKTTIIEMNRSTFDKKKSKTMWKDRATVFYKSFKVEVA